MSKTVRRAILLLEEFRKIDPVMQMQQALTFLMVAEAGEEGLPMLELQRRLGVSSSTASRNASALSKVHWRDPSKEGYDLATREENPLDRRNKVLRLSARGKRILNTVNALLEK